MTATLTTDRLILRPFLPGEEPALETLLREQNARSLFDAGGRRVSPGRLAQRIVRDAARRRPGDPPPLSLAFALVTRADDRLIGAVLLARDDNRGAELGLWLAPARRRQGFAIEALKAVLAFGFETLALERITGACDADNTDSIRLMRKGGMTFRHKLHAEGPRGARVTRLVFARARTDFFAAVRGPDALF